VALYASAMIIAIFLNVQEVVFNFLGAVCETLITMIFPSLFYVMLIQNRNQPKLPQYFIAWALLIFSVPYSIFSVFCTFYYLGDYTS
jgi:hypothetical protein